MWSNWDPESPTRWSQRRLLCGRLSIRDPASRQQHLPTSRTDLHAVAVGIQSHALVVAITRPARIADDRMAVVTELLDQLVHVIFGADRQRQVCQSHPLRAGTMFHGLQRSRLHDLQPRTTVETDEPRFETVGRVDIAIARVPCEVRAIERYESVDIPCPQSNVIDTDHVSSVVELLNQKLLEFAVGIAALDGEQSPGMTQDLPDPRNHPTPVAVALQLDQHRRTEWPETGFEVRERLPCQEAVAIVGEQ